MITPRDALFVLAMSLFAVPFELSAADEPCMAPDSHEITAAVFTGRYANGLPVYQLPSVNVVGTRSTEIAKIGREARPAANRAVQSRRG